MTTAQVKSDQKLLVMVVILPVWAKFLSYVELIKSQDVYSLVLVLSFWL